LLEDRSFPFKPSNKPALFLVVGAPHDFIFGTIFVFGAPGDLRVVGVAGEL
jgi:hypothetical protein